MEYMVYFHIWNLLFVIYYNIALECDDILLPNSLRASFAQSVN